MTCERVMQCMLNSCLLLYARLYIILGIICLYCFLVFCHTALTVNVLYLSYQIFLNFINDLTYITNQFLPLVILLIFPQPHFLNILNGLCVHAIFSICPLHMCLHVWVMNCIQMSKYFFLITHFLHGCQHVVHACTQCTLYMLFTMGFTLGGCKPVA